MKKIFLLLACFILTLAVDVHAQTERDKVEALRVAFISRHVGLSPAEAERFWPVYNEYNDKLRAVKRNLRQTYKRFDERMGEEGLQQLYEAERLSRQAEVDVHRLYSEKIKGIIGYRKYLRLRVAEEEFKREMINTIRDRGE